MGRYAICVGIDDYDNLPEGWDSLEFAGVDARAMSEILLDTAYGAFDKVELLTKPAQTTLSGLIDALKRLFYEIKPEPDDLVLLYFAGHCGLDPQDRLFLIPSDGRINHWGIPDLASMLRLENIAAYFSGSYTNNLVLVLDMAYTGERSALARRVKLTENPNFFTIGSIISAEIIDQLHMLKHSPFSYSLFKALKQPPKPDGWLMVSSIQNFIVRQLRELLDTYWAEHSQMLNYPSELMDDLPLLRVASESEEFTREVKIALQRNGYRMGNTNRFEQKIGRLRAEITVAFTRAVIEVLALDNGHGNWSELQAQQFAEQIERLKTMGEITHGLIISRNELDQEILDYLRRTKLDYMTLEDALAQV
ncbi:MAG: caspase family protein [Chloroflexi bacterium]|uniref:Caspase family protein n=1 Tax=Candidatus Chlorohelix allophototropha TaxID=3003348 RepID=A0A8T7M2Q6_9CHLR|nr:caspase family protein [Chloroflexota bacterium]WJW67350.1 caspase family protein [Chloroflexota bacterium L227-S17]